jgi:hypothetical protein
MLIYYLQQRGLLVQCTVSTDTIHCTNAPTLSPISNGYRAPGRAKTHSEQASSLRNLAMRRPSTISRTSKAVPVAATAKGAKRAAAAHRSPPPSPSAWLSVQTISSAIPTFTRRRMAAKSSAPSAP